MRARRTILSADTVSFLAAAILYYFASADVKGFAFTLGMSTILDLVVVFLFTHPIVVAALAQPCLRLGPVHRPGRGAWRTARLTPTPSRRAAGAVAAPGPSEAETADCSGKATVVLDKNDDRDVADEAADEPGIGDSTPELDAAGLDESRRCRRS